MISLLISSSLISFLYADSGYETYGGEYDYYGGGDDQGVEGCCECTESSDEPYCNDECDNTICPYDPYCCNEEYGSWDWICANSAVDECQGTAGGDYGEYDYYGDNDCGGNDYYDDYGDYGDYDECNCDEICYGQEPEDWEFEYEEVPPCIIDNCGQQLDTCANDDSCVEGIEGMVSSCYADNEDPMQCMDGLVQDTENNGFNDLCDGNDQCGADLKSLGECVVNSANYGFCPEEEYKKLKLKSVLKTIKKRTRSRKRKSVAAKQKLKRKSKRSRKSKRTKKRGKRASKLRTSRRKLQSSDGTNTEYDGSGSDYYYDDYENPEYDYGCYCDCGDEEEEIPDCIIDNCGEQLYACGSSDACISGVEGVISKCYEDNDSPTECMDELMKESNGAEAIELCGGDEEAAGDLQALGTCVINSANYGFCSEEEYKKLKIKALVKATKKVRARKAASKQRKARSSKRARSSKLRARSQRKRSRKVRPRSRKALSQRQARKQRSRKSRRKLQSVPGNYGFEYNYPATYYDNSYNDFGADSYYNYGPTIPTPVNNGPINSPQTQPGYNQPQPNPNQGQYPPGMGQPQQPGGYTDSYQAPPGSGSGDYGFEYNYPPAGYDNSYNDLSGGLYPGSDVYGTDSYYGGYDGDSYQMQDSYYPPKQRQRQRQRHVRPRPRARAQRQRSRKVRPRSRRTSARRQKRERAQALRKQRSKKVRGRTQRRSRRKLLNAKAPKRKLYKWNTPSQSSYNSGPSQSDSYGYGGYQPSGTSFEDSYYSPTSGDYNYYYGGSGDYYEPMSGDYDYYGGSGEYDYYGGDSGDYNYYDGSDYNYYDTSDHSGGVYDYDYDYYGPSSDDYYDIDGNNYNYDYYGGDDDEGSYDISDYDYDYEYDGSYDTYEPPSKRKSRRVASRKQKQRRQRPRSRARVSKKRRPRPVKRQRQRSRRQRVRRARR